MQLLKVLVVLSGPRKSQDGAEETQALLDDAGTFRLACGPN
ncbi:hypothetical protein [Streptomyces sp. NPDC087437]